jgi:hypothetical protein
MVKRRVDGVLFNHRVHRVSQRNTGNAALGSTGRVQEYWVKLPWCFVIRGRAWDGETVVRTDDFVLRTPLHCDHACGGCQFPGNGARLRCQRRSRSVPGPHRPIDIGRKPCSVWSRRFHGERVLQSRRNTRNPGSLGGRPMAFAFWHDALSGGRSSC